jgi:hypothetical protein
LEASTISSVDHISPGVAQIQSCFRESLSAFGAASNAIAPGMDSTQLVAIQFLGQTLGFVLLVMVALPEVLLWPWLCIDGPYSCVVCEPLWASTS